MVGVRAGLVLDFFNFEIAWIASNELEPSLSSYDFYFKAFIEPRIQTSNLGFLSLDRCLIGFSKIPDFVFIKPKSQL